MEGQRLVDRPGPPARVALAHGREGRRDRRRMMAVVVDHGHAAGLALHLEPAAHAGERRQPVQDRPRRGAVGERGSGCRERVVGVVAARERELDRGTGVAREAVDAQGRAPGGVRRVLGDQGCRGTGRRAMAFGQVGTSSSRVDAPLDDLGDDEPPRPVRETWQELGHAPVARVRDESGQASRAVPGQRTREPPDPAFEGGDHRDPVREHVGVIPIGIQQDADGRPVRVEVPGVLVGLDDGRPPLPQPDDRRTGTADRGRQDGADERRRVEAGPDEKVHQAAGRGRLAVGPGDRQEVATARRDGVGDELLAAPGRDAGVAGRDELGVIGGDRGEGLRDRDPVGLRTAVRVGDVGRVVPPGDRDPGIAEGIAVGRRLARVAAGHVGAGGAGEEERGRRRGPGRAEDMDPRARDDRPGGPGRFEAPRDVLDRSGHEPAARGPAAPPPRPGDRRRPPGSRWIRPPAGAARAPNGRSPSCWRPGRRLQRGGGPRSRSGRPRRRRSARPAWRASHRPVRRCR